MGATHFSGPVVSAGGFNGTNAIAAAKQAGVGITGGTGTSVTYNQVKTGNTILTHIIVDITGLTVSTTDLDIIGTDGSGVAYLLQIDTSQCGVPISGSMSCLEVPTTGIADVDLYAADEGTGVEDVGIGTLAETAIVTAGGAWTLGKTAAFTATPQADQYLYLTAGAAGTPGLYDAGIFMIEIVGYEA